MFLILCSAELLVNGNSAGAVLVSHTFWISLFCFPALLIMLCAQYNGCVSVSNVLCLFWEERLQKISIFLYDLSRFFSLDDATELQPCFFLSLSFSSPFHPYLLLITWFKGCKLVQLPFFPLLSTLIFPLDDATGLEQWILSHCSVRNRNWAPWLPKGHLTRWGHGDGSS